MVFSSITFLFFFLPITLGLYFLVDNKFKNYIIIISSLFFYAWGEPIYVFFMLCSIVINYLFGLWIDKSKKKSILILSIMTNLGFLIFFKYTPFLIDNLNLVFSTMGINQIPILRIVMPIGISFFTFQSMSYVIDLYRGEISVQKNISKLALYISMFPQLIAGPIVRYIDVEKQIDNRTHSLEKTRYGIKRFIIGLGKKVLLSNVFALAVDQIFAYGVNDISTALSWVGIIAYTLQIYFDFSGYSDMAIGLGKIFGFDFMENFNYPYISKNIKEFWRRWHISLSTWFRDYLYIPLGGNRKGPIRSYINLFIVFLLCGFWHGASWTFIIWGMYHGLFLILERLNFFNKFLSKLNNVALRIYTLVVVMVGWVFFRADNLPYALNYIKNMFIYNEGTVHFDEIVSFKLIVFLILGIVFATPLSNKKFVLNFKSTLGKYMFFLEDIILMLIFCLCVFSLSSSTYNPFIYFRF